MYPSTLDTREKFLKRLETFQNPHFRWPVDWISGERMASAGFKYTYESDIVSGLTLQQ